METVAAGPHGSTGKSALERTVPRPDTSAAADAEAIGHQEWIKKLLAGQEAERRRISLELHDRIGQEVTALVLGLKALEKSAREPEDAATIDRLLEIATSIGARTHGLAVELRPAGLDHLGLVRALANYAEDWAARVGVSIEFHTVGMDGVRLPTEIETTIYRIVQEALTNVVKHANAQRVSLLVERKNDEVIAIVEDDGMGIAGTAPLGKGLGLIGMQERARLVNGSVQVESSARTGTAVYIRMPLTGSPATPEEAPVAKL